MIPGEMIVADGELELNAELMTIRLIVANSVTGLFKWVRITIFMKPIQH